MMKCKYCEAARVVALAIACVDLDAGRPITWTSALPGCGTQSGPVFEGPELSIAQRAENLLGIRLLYRAEAQAKAYVSPGGRHGYARIIHEPWGGKHDVMPPSGSLGEMEAASRYPDMVKSGFFIERVDGCESTVSLL
jgi:hypothetical protein